ncbi:MAG: NAD(+)/NADH kinase [Betaproteobacteria bacterium]|jgi:NAD+ kinase|nr:NAD(+)/NADH kinase [Betaproteobacteria bacterium]
MATNTFHNISLVGKYQSADGTETVLELARFLRGRGMEPWIEQGTAEGIGKVADDFVTATYEEIADRSDLVVVIGGDGTLLNAARRLSERAVPLLGVNLGRLGFLTDLSRVDVCQQLGEILDGRFHAESRFMLDAEVTRGGSRIFHTQALNDVVVNRGKLGRMIELELMVDDVFVYNLRSDGMIIATPTGSTAYAMAANGPILHPGVGGIALVPLCPHALTARPITLPDGCCIDIVIMPPHDARIHFDGVTYCDVRAGDQLRIVRSEREVLLLHPEGYGYFAMLRAKLHWGAAMPRP